MHHGWADRHRPQEIEHVALTPALRERFKRVLDRGHLARHLILFGPPGWGKTSLAEILKRRLYDADQLRVMDVDATKNEEEDQALAALHRELDGAVRSLTAALRIEAQLSQVRARLSEV